MTDFSIELEAERIVDRRSKAYFHEVYSSYASGNYRSAVVMLWSVVVCDVLFKLDELRSAYGDATATAIVDDVTKMQVKAPASPEWELELVKRVYEQTSLLDVGEYNGLVALQRQRHLSAHPVLTGGFELYAPTREAARAAIRHALEALLTKPALMTKKVFDALTEDLEQIRDTLPQEDVFRQYLQAKYFSRLRHPVEDQLFRSLWRLVFKVLDARAETNRIVNYRALRAMADRRPSEVAQLVGADRDYFSSVATSESTLRTLSALLFFHPKLFSLLTDAARAPLRAYADKDDKLAGSWFLSPSMRAHLSTLLKLAETERLQLKRRTFESLYGACSDPDDKTLARHLAAELYVQSGSYKTADANFELVRACIEDFGEPELRRLLDGSEKNRQVHSRGHEADHALVRDTCHRVFGAAFDATAYPNMVAAWS